MSIRVAVIGCGNRGADVYGTHLQSLGAQIVALVDPRAGRLAEVGARLDVPAHACHAHWDDLFALGRVADAVVIATPDHQHVEPCLRALDLGYHVLLEKPICLDEAELDHLLRAEAESAGTVTVCHVLRSTPIFKEVRGVLDAGVLGPLIGITWSENVGWWHYAHSYVRGNWRASPPAAPFLLAKACHDLDLLRWYAGSPPVTVGSVGGLHHFRPEQAPAGAQGRCVECPVADCPYDARTIYLGRPTDVWPVTVLVAGGGTLADALADGPYGECVYAGHNTVVDHQAVTLGFAGGLTAQLTVSAFTHDISRTFKLVGPYGELRGHMERGELELHDFRTGTARTWHVPTDGNHGGGDFGLVRTWLSALRGEGGWPSPLSVSVDSHRMAFAAERARLTGVAETL
ncbi:putative dehydrogenase [Deinococcus metalli]|uniref:Putative dehydrogenase n=1 Tax=Deinococcus metalli TaxID=1141878 RepID=A0A7W8KCP8_9DEIO|nr:Gfo/Idh/MocA family oxidoreductase [Deinococcus metalli]MBB5375298.1 putative dehydrogenase [Deinococcus metalli]GHF30276.1 streptomycin biosynthesis protein StrI [Deinococcus metalli]